LENDHVSHILIVVEMSVL